MPNTIDYRTGGGGSTLSTSAPALAGAMAAPPMADMSRFAEGLIARKEEQERRRRLEAVQAQRQEQAAQQQAARQMSDSGPSREEDLKYQIANAQHQAMSAPPPMKMTGQAGGWLGPTLDPTKMNAYQRQAYLPQESVSRPRGPDENDPFGTQAGFADIEKRRREEQQRGSRINEG